MKTIPVYDPRGVVEAAPLTLAPRVKKLDGLRLGLLDNTKWNANKLLRGIRDRLARKHAFGAVNYYRRKALQRRPRPNCSRKSPRITTSSSPPSATEAPARRAVCTTR
jgi:hypothetical protein